MTLTAPGTFQRDAYTWLAYFMLGYFAFYQVSSGLIISFLRDEFGYSYTVGGLHVSALALGSSLVGAFGNAFVKRLGRQRVFWGGGAGMGLGVLVVITGQHPAITILGMFITGILGTFILAMVNATLADKHQRFRAYALTEANIMAALVSTGGPFLVGAFTFTGLSWRAAMVVPFLFWLLARLTLATRIPVPKATAETRPSSESTHIQEQLPQLYWWYWTAVVLCVSAEWCAVAWGATFLDDAVGLTTADAAALMSVFFVSVTVGRVFGSILTRRFPAEQLLFGTIVLSIAGFMLFWLSPMLPLTVVGMVITGLGFANQYPMGLTAATNAAPLQPDLAAIRLSLGVGLAIMLVPQLLGSLADFIGIETAFGIANVFMLAALFITLFAMRFQRQMVVQIEAQ